MLSLHELQQSVRREGGEGGAGEGALTLSTYTTINSVYDGGGALEDTYTTSYNAITTINSVYDGSGALEDTYTTSYNAITTNSIIGRYGKISTKIYADTMKRLYD